MMNEFNKNSKKLFDTTIQDYIQADHHHHQGDSQLELQFELDQELSSNQSIDEDYQINLIQSNQHLLSQLKHQTFDSDLISPNEFMDWLKITISPYQSQQQEPLNLNEIIKIIQSDQSQDLKSNQLLDLLGFHYLSLIEPIISNQSLIKEQDSSSHRINHHQNNNQNNHYHNHNHRIKTSWNRRYL
ncbi:uncharacterized protein MELLADRAFT_65282 [Melampsora larici-populina 98AG31]|uniref:Uncharacterized protein n=1 Tax=Melampsora larici-populina (strain 98AG31 / pathotype 3-4-7) TaxID=747676 RepID=F4RUR2_MELLP|nr:uncharacterized protein MELLADRAFT_65282 [Melampsora larici-populina 98AG31]EGG03879.1 hypothetical protein MELLADRAFT_65282 [Melampsora larici-populina 98AG31]